MQIIESFGIEIEVVSLPYRLVRRIAPRNWRVTEDGTIRDFHQTIGPILLNRQRNGTKQGGEIVSPILGENNWKQQITALFARLRAAGESFDLRAGIHVHINATGLPLFALHNLVHLGLWAEAPMYKIACGEMGFHRGSRYLDYGFCRPLGSAPVSRSSGETIYRKAFTPETLLQTKSLREVNVALARHDLAGGKYPAARFKWLNFVSLFTQGSAEFRVFNQTLTPAYLFAWIDVCKNIVQASFQKRVSLKPQPLGSNCTENMFWDFVEVLLLRNSTGYVLEKLWHTAKTPANIVGPQMGHLNHTTNWEGIPLRLVPPEVDPDIIVDFDYMKPTKTTVRRGVCAC